MSAFSWVGRTLRNRHADESLGVWRLPELQAPETIVVTSPDFVAGGVLPTATAAAPIGKNVSPALEWAGLPDRTAALVIVIEDPDVPLRRPVVHTIAALPRAGSDVPAGVRTGGLAADAADAWFLPAAFGRRGYAGPRPIPGHGPHRYAFMVFAFDRAVAAQDARTPSGTAALRRVASVARVLSRGRIVGTFERA